MGKVTVDDTPLFIGRFENGAIAYPVSEITVAGNMLVIYRRLVPASDLEFRGSLNTPSILVEDLTIAGQ